MKKRKHIICPDCAAEYEETLPKCPYCGRMNYKGAEIAYLNKLEDVRDDMEALGEIPQQAVKAELKKQGHLVRKIIIIIVCVLMALCALVYVRLHPGTSKVSEKEQFLWQSENFPKFDAMYAAGEYQELADVLQKELQGDYSIWDYQHRAFAFVYDNISDAKMAMQMIDSGEDTSRDMYTTLLYNQMDFMVQWGRKGQLSERERAIIEPLKDVIVEDFQTRWQMSDEEYQDLLKKAEENYHVMPYDEAEKYVKKWLKKRK